MIDKTGSSATGFELADAQGTLHSLDRYRSAWLLLVFHRHLG